MACLSESQVLRVLEDQLDAAGKAAVEEHVDACDVCRRLLTDLVRCESTPMREALPSEPPPDSQPAPDSGAVRPRTSKLDCGMVLAGRYLVMGLAGLGGMGVVYAAYDQQLDRKIAVKLVRPEHGSAERLVQEAQSLARLSHPNVVVVHDVGVTLGHAYMAMEYVEGQTLRRWLGEAMRAPEHILKVYLEAAVGLAAAHAAGLAHRDFKPDNVLIDNDGRVRVTDFGLARPLSAADAPGGGLEGTPPYISPERFRGQPADARSDQFSFCVALYEALYGEHPFRFSSHRDLPQAMQEGRVRPPPRGSKVPSAVRAALLRGLAADPAARFPSMTALAAALGGVARRRRAWPLVVAALVAPAMLLGAVVEAAQSPDDPALCDAAYVFGAKLPLLEIYAELGKQTLDASAPCGASCKAREPRMDDLEEEHRE